MKILYTFTCIEITFWQRGGVTWTSVSCYKKTKWGKNMVYILVKKTMTCLSSTRYKNRRSSNLSFIRSKRMNEKCSSHSGQKNEVFLCTTFFVGISYIGKFLGFFFFFILLGYIQFFMHKHRILYATMWGGLGGFKPITFPFPALVR